jgi:protein-disulfide isomerase
MHQQAQGAAEAANCAAEQGKFWEYHDRLFQNQQALHPPSLKQYAGDLGMNVEQFNSCFDSGKYRGDVMQDMAEAQRLGVSGTPAFFVNGRFLSGAQPYEAFAQIINEELARTGGGAPSAAN